MAPTYSVIASKAARDQLARLYLKYRRLRYVANADSKIEKALRQNPQGGHPVFGKNNLSITVFPLIATYQIVGNEVRILEYEDATGG